MLHKAVHVQIDVADAVVKVRQTWAYLNGYQGALFALTALLGLLGVSISKDSTGSEGVLMADVWPEEAFNARSVTAMYEDEAQGRAFSRAGPLSEMGAAEEGSTSNHLLEGKRTRIAVDLRQGRRSGIRISPQPSELCFDSVAQCRPTIR